MEDNEVIEKGQGKKKREGVCVKRMEGCNITFFPVPVSAIAFILEMM